MPEITVRPGIPCPQTSTVTPVERRLMTENNHPRMRARTIETDERQVQQMTWALDNAQAREFRGWWRDDLIFGGAWFSAPTTWPTPEGLVVKVRRFITPPSFQYLGVGNWLVSAALEVRGRTLLPVDVVVPPVVAHFLDTFSESEIALYEHTPDDAPIGFAYVQPMFGEGLLVGEGGHAFNGGDGDHNVSNLAPGAWETMVFTEGLRFEMDGFSANGMSEYQPGVKVILYADDDVSSIELYARGSDGSIYVTTTVSGPSYAVSGTSESVDEGAFQAALTIFPNGAATLEFNGVTQTLEASGDPSAVLRISRIYYEISNVSFEDSLLDRVELQAAQGEPPSGGVLFFDDFDGAGNLSDHAPDVAPPGFSWVAPDPDNGLGIDSGQAFNQGSGTYTTSNVEAWSIAPTNDWRAEMTVVMAANPVDGTQVSWYLGAGDDVSGLTLEFNGIAESDPGQGYLRVHIAGQEFTSETVFAGLFDVRVDVHSSNATVFLNDEELTTLTGDFSGFASITYTEVSALGTIDEASFLSVRLSTLEPA